MRQPEPAQKLFLCHFFGFTYKHVPGLLMIGPWKYEPGEQLVEPDKRDYPLEFMTGHTRKRERISRRMMAPQSTDERTLSGSISSRVRIMIVPRDTPTKCADSIPR